MKSTLEKEEMLRSAGFRYYFQRMAYINRDSKKIVSIEAVEDKPEEWLRDMIAQSNPSGEWRFYFSHGQQPSAEVKKAFLADLG